MKLNGVSGAQLRLQRITKSYGSRDAVRAMDLEISAGEFFTILGPSGSGKTTTLMLIAGFIEPTSGEIYISGNPVSRVPAHKRNIGVVFQNYGLFPHMTVARNVAFPLKLRGRAKVETTERVDSMLNMVQLSPFRDHMPEQLSGGQQQRVALARALVFQPKVLLLDEPLSALDKNLREEMQIELKTLHRKIGTTIVCVTHDQAEALALSDRIAVLNAGGIEQVDTPECLYEHPCSCFVAKFIGESNSIAGRVIEDSESHSSIATADGLMLTARKTAACRVGTPAEVIVRPQHVLLGDEARHAGNSFQGTIRNRLYSGDCVKLEIEVSRTISILAQVPNTRVSSADYVSGDQINTGFEPDNAMVFPVQRSAQDH